MIMFLDTWIPRFGMRMSIAMGITAYKFAKRHDNIKKSLF